MIKMLRIDERLIHGQIVVDWSRYLGVNAIIVGNDMAATNSVVEMTLRMALKSESKQFEGRLMSSAALKWNNIKFSC